MHRPRAASQATAHGNQGLNRTRTPLQAAFPGGLFIAQKIVYSAHDARLAQLVEHLIDVERVVGSSPTPRTP